MTPRFLKARVGATVSALLATMLTTGLAYVTAAPAAAASSTISVDCGSLPAVGVDGWVSVGGSDILRRVEVAPGDVVTVVSSNCLDQGAVFGKADQVSTLSLTPSSSLFHVASSATLNDQGTSIYWISHSVDTLTVTAPTTIPKTQGSQYNGNSYSNTFVRLSTNSNPKAYISLVSTQEARLSDLALGSYPSQISLNEAFSSETTTYTASTMQSSTQVNVTKLLDWSNAATAVSCNGSSINVGGSCALSIGSNTIAVTQTALDGSTTRTYTVTVTRSAAPSRVTFMRNGGTGGITGVYVMGDYIQTSNAPAALASNGFTRPNDTFTGWNTAANGSGTAYANGATYNFASNLTLYAQWASQANSGQQGPSAPTVVPIRNDIPYVTANDVTKSADGGRVALKGEKLSEVKSITVGGKKVDTFTVNASGQLEFALPAGLTGEQDVQLTGKDSVLSFRVNATPTAAPAVTAPVVPVLTKVSTVARKGNAVQIAAAAWKGVTTQTHQLYVCSTQTWAGVGAAAPAGCIQTQTPASDASSFSVDLKPRWAGKYLVVVTTVANGAGTTTKSWSNGVRI